MAKSGIFFILGLVIGLGALYAVERSRGASAAKLETVYQAVLLDNNQVYYGKVRDLGSAFPVLTDVYYIQQQVNPQTKEVKNILVRRGNEWHSPDRMVINARHIVLVEPVSPSSKVAQLIAELKSKNP